MQCKLQKWQKPETHIELHHDYAAGHIQTGGDCRSKALGSSTDKLYDKKEQRSLEIKRLKRHIFKNGQV